MRVFFQFKEDHEIKENSGFYRNYPTLSDKMHCVLFVVRANDLDEQRFGTNDIDEKTYFSVLHSMQQYLRNKSKCLFLLHFIGRHKNYILQKRYYIKMYSNNLIIPHIYQSEHCDFDS